MRFIFPSDPLDPKEVDPTFVDQRNAFLEAGYDISTISIEYLQVGESKIYPSIKHDELAVYRGWMMNEQEYKTFISSILCVGGKPLIDLPTYLSCHHLPNWYKLISDLTPQTQIFPADADLKAELDTLGWESFFVKDYVKSLKTGSGSLLQSTDGLDDLVHNMEKYRGQIEGGFCIREVEEFDLDSEERFFVINGKPFSSDTSQVVPNIVKQVTSRIQSPFYSIDVVRRSDGVDRIVEIGDGQVSDLVGWTAERFVEIWNASCYL